MPDTITIGLRDYNGRILHLINIYRSYFLAALVVSIKVTKLRIKDGSLQLIHTRVTTSIVVNVFLFAAVVAESANHSRQGVVIGSHGTCIAKGTEVLARIEAMTCGITY